MGTLYFNGKPYPLQQGTGAKNQDKIITKNGTYTADERYTGLGTVEVKVPEAYIKRYVEDNVLLMPETSFDLSLPFSDLGSNVLRSAYYGCDSLRSLSFPNLTRISGSSALLGVIGTSGCEHLNFPVLREVTGNYALSGMTVGPSVLKDFSFPELTSVSGSSAFSEAFRSAPIRTAIFPKLTKITGSLAFYSAFSDSSLTFASFPELVQILGHNSFAYAFSDNYNLAQVEFPELIQIGEEGRGEGEFRDAFSGCSSLDELSFPKLEKIYCSSYSYDRGTFSGNYYLKKISFPKLTTIEGTLSSSIFFGCYELTEIHFGAENEEAIKATSGYTTLWGRGAGNATVYFDL